MRASIRSVYLHAPFCAKRCFYCDFAVTVSESGDLEGWLKAVTAELLRLEEEGLFTLAPTLDTLFVGGGTPSVLGPRAMGGVAQILGARRLEDPALEWTAEANPESFSAEVAREWAAAGVNRISLGAQSFQDGVLRWMGRLHGPSGPAEALARAREAGITNLSLDLMFGLPPEVERDWGEELRAAVALDVPHLSLYGLSVEAGTPLAKAVDRGQVSVPREDRYREEFLEASRVLTAAGYRHYELSNFALPGFECRHNQVYWTHRPYLGLGNSAHSFLPPLRRWNLRNWGEYQESALAGQRVWAGEEQLGPEETRLERIWLSLRTRDGLPVADLPPGAPEMVSNWALKGWAVQDEERVTLTPEGWLLLDELVVALADLE